MKHLKKRNDFLNEAGASNTPPRTGSAPTQGSELADAGGGAGVLPEPRRNFVYYSWEDFINTDFKVFYIDVPEQEQDEYGIYKLIIGDHEYVLTPCVVYERKVTNVHLVDLKDGEVYATISEEIPESKDLKQGEFYINPNIDEYESIIYQLIDQGFMTKKEKSNQIVGEESSDIYKVLGL